MKNGIVFMTQRASRVKEHYDVVFDIPEKEALFFLDVGRVELIAVNRARVDYEIKAYEKLGYHVKAE